MTCPQAHRVSTCWINVDWFYCVWCLSQLRGHSKYCRLGGCKDRRRLFLQFWRLDSPNQGARRGEHARALFPARRWLSLLCACGESEHGFVFLFSWGHRSHWVRPPPLWLHVNLSVYWKPYLRIYWHWAGRWLELRYMNLERIQFSL